MKKIESFEQACEALGYDKTIPNFDQAPERHRKALSAHYQLVIITEAINDDKDFPNWLDTDQRKWELFPDIVKDESKSSGLGLSYHDFAYWFSYTSVGSRLCFKSREAAKHCFDTFQNLWEDYFLIG